MWNDLNERGFNFSVKDYAGSNVMSCFELIIKMPFRKRDEKVYQQSVR